MVDVRTLQSGGRRDIAAGPVRFERDCCSLQLNEAQWEAGAAAVAHSGLLVQWLQDANGTIECSLDGVTFRKASTIFCLPPAVELHCQWTTGRSRILSVDYAPRDDEDLGTMVAELNDLDVADMVDLSSGFVHALMARLEQELLRPGLGREVMVDALLATLVAELHGRLGRRPDTATAASLSRHAVARLCELIRETNGTLPSLAELARACGVPSRRLSESVRMATGMTLRAYVAQERLDKARAMLGDRRMLIKQVAYACGFASPAAFTAAFHKASGETPQEFRARLQT